MCLDLSKLYKDLKFVIEDRPQILQKAEEVWNNESPGAAQSGLVRFVPHDFFKPNPIKGAEVYLLRCVL